MSQATVTAQVGPGLTATAIVIQDIVEIDMDLPGEVLTLTQSNGRISTYALTGSNTITLTASGGTYTLTIA